MRLRRARRGHAHEASEAGGMYVRRARRLHAREASEAEGMNVRELAQYVGGSFGIMEMIGTPTSNADEMAQWLDSDACDGFNIMFPYLPGGLDDFVDQVVPELQRRGIFRREYEGRTLRENLGLPRPGNQFFPD